MSRFWAVLVAYLVGMVWGAVPRFNRWGEFAVGVLLGAAMLMLATHKPALAPPAPQED